MSILGGAALESSPRLMHFGMSKSPKFLEGADIIRAWGEIRLGCPAPESASIVLFSGHRKIPIIRFERLLGIYTQHFYRMI